MRSKRDTKSPLSTTTTVQVRVSFCFHLGITKTPEKSSQAEAARLLEPWLNACISTLWSSGVPGIGQDALETLDVTRVGDLLDSSAVVAQNDFFYLLS